jgi:hypothetical protein
MAMKILRDLARTRGFRTNGIRRIGAPITLFQKVSSFFERRIFIPERDAEKWGPVFR